MFYLATIQAADVAPNYQVICWAIFLENPKTRKGLELYGKGVRLL